MPEHSSPVRELILADRPEALAAGIPWICFGAASASFGAGSIDLSKTFRNHQISARAAFIEWLGEVNAANASIRWWAHTTSAKNILSSPLGNEILELLALKALLENTQQARIGLLGATKSQVQALRTIVAPHLTGLRVSGSAQTGEPSKFATLRVLWQFLNILIAWGAWMRGLRARKSADVVLFTYADRNFHGGNDAFFGSFADLLADSQPPRSCLYIAYVQGPYRTILSALRSARRPPYSALFAELSFVDLINALFSTLAAQARIGAWPRTKKMTGLDIDPLLRDALRWDITHGGYFHHFLVYLAMRRLGKRLAPRLVIYPYENKSLEKLLLLGLRESAPACRIHGYQHTSVTPRHTTLLFATNEAKHTPLPDRIVTVGDVTRVWLDENGRYPQGLLRTGFALRQPQRAPIERRRDMTPATVRVLFALSSSVAELIEAARWLLDASRLSPGWKFAIRPHPEFPLGRLPADLRRAVEKLSIDFTGSSLEENLLWCDVVVYTSSTVALEALMAGRPIVNLDLGDLLNADPVIEETPLRWRADSVEQMMDAILEIATLEADALDRKRQESRWFTERYFRAFDSLRLNVFFAG